MAEESYNLWVERHKDKSHPQRDASGNSPRKELSKEISKI
jgi:hypothetical protein